MKYCYGNTSNNNITYAIYTHYPAALVWTTHSLVCDPEQCSSLYCI